MSHLDTWDPKPDAPAEVRGEFGPSPPTPGIQVGEHMPLLARQTERLAIVRSVHHRWTAHGKGMYWNMTGHPPPQPEVAVNLPPSLHDWPNLGSMVARLRSRRAACPGRCSCRIRWSTTIPSRLATAPAFSARRCAAVLLRPSRGRPYGGVSRDLALRS